ncbi:MAG: hypothetical protein ACXABY_12635, partial [Candidatus Thorarchaeota archaeon]
EDQDAKPAKPEYGEKAGKSETVVNVNLGPGAISKQLEELLDKKLAAIGVSTTKKSIVPEKKGGEVKKSAEDEISMPLDKLNKIPIETVMEMA